MSESEKMRIALSRHFVDSGEKERLMSILRARLVESGWNDNLYAFCRDTVRSRNLSSITMDDLVKEAAEHGRGSVNENIKKELLTHIKKYLDAALE
ncbi:enhancer of yellow 2 transcription factor-like protein B-like protein [Lichtheimia hyalospora FSU 10163]|nr:enhancer of yellow 2 transcription factor-like protein B-like protein [Lichtheimia hyalospora FSU 10163]